MIPFIGSKGRGTKEPLDEGEKGEWESWLKTQHSKNEDHGIWPHHFMANRWGKMGQWQILFSWAPESLWMVTVAMTLKDAPWKKSNDKPGQHIKKQRHHFAYKGLYSQSNGFKVVIYGCESWTIKKTEGRIDAFELWCWRRCLRVPWTARRSISQS